MREQLEPSSKRVMPGPQSPKRDTNEIASLLTVQEVAKLLAVHPNTVRRWSDQGMLKAYRLGRRGDRRFPKADLMEALSKIVG